MFLSKIKHYLLVNLIVILSLSEIAKSASSSNDFSIPAAASASADLPSYDYDIGDGIFSTLELDNLPEIANWGDSLLNDDMDWGDLLSGVFADEAEGSTKDINAEIRSQVLEYLQKRKLQLYAHQVAGVSYIIEHKETLLADDMGLGKTVQAIMSCFIDPNIKTVTLIIPNVLVDHWKREICSWAQRCNENFEFYDRHNYNPHGASSAAAKASDKEATKFLFLTPSWIRLEGSQSRLEDIKNQFILTSDITIIDEVHLVSTGKKTHPILKSILDHNPLSKVLLLSGTPIRQNVEYELNALNNLLRSTSFQGLKNREQIVTQLEIYLLKKL